MISISAKYFFYLLQFASRNRQQRVHNHHSQILLCLLHINFRIHHCLLAYNWIVSSKMDVTKPVSVFSLCQFKIRSSHEFSLEYNMISNVALRTKAFLFTGRIISYSGLNEATWVFDPTKRVSTLMIHCYI